MTETLHASFEAQVRRTPEAVAVVYEGNLLTYRELDERANRLAHRLRAAGVRPEIPVGLYLPRSEAPIVAILGILKAGGYYVPIDPGYPPERRAWILSDSGTRIVIATRTTLDDLDGVTAIAIDDDFSAYPTTSCGIEVLPDHLAYAIYTSGSTGRPKGSSIPHRNVVRLLSSTRDWFAFGPDDVWTVFHSFAFDFTVWEIWGALLYGGRAVVVPEATRRSPDELLELICTQGVTVLNQTPSVFRLVMHAALSSERWSKLPLRWVIFGGEALDIPSLAPWFGRYGDREPTLVNMYGITETTVHVTYRAVVAADTRSRRSVIGEAIPDQTLHVLDPALNPVATNDTGELYVGGAGASRGYLGMPALTAERFLPDPFSAQPGARMYRSGDLGRRLGDRDIEHLGRADFQVKLRGYRIEVGEIEIALATHADVRSVVVLACTDMRDDKRLVAYVVPRDVAAPPTFAGMQDHLRPKLPDYMIPTAFVLLERFPVTPHGKLDRAALPPPKLERPAGQRESPSGEIEVRIAALAGELLGVDDVGATDDLFAFGMHSLLLMKLRVRVEHDFGVVLPLRELFLHASVRRVAELVLLGQDAILEQSADLEALLAEVADLSDEEAAALLESETP